MVAILKRIVSVGGRIVRDAWQVAGIILALVLLLETGYRVQGAVRRALSSDKGPAWIPDPLAPPAWRSDYDAELGRTELLAWSPYVYFRNPPTRGRYITIDSLGRRVTIPPVSTGGRVIRVFFFGGSTMLGWFQRDGRTIPDEAVRRLQQVAGPGVRIQATNFGVPGRVFSQEIIELMLQLRSGNRPDAVVFYDGINDVIATVENGAAGIPENESNRAEDFARGRLFVADSGHGLQHDFRYVGRVLVPVLQRLELVQRLEAFRSRTAPPLISADSAARSETRVYAENVRIVEALARSYGFQPLYVWEPDLQSTHKPLTAHEAWLLRSMSDPLRARRGEVHVVIPALLDSAMAGIAPGRFIDATDLFRGDSTEIFEGKASHNTEAAVPQIVDAFLPQLAAALSRHQVKR
jgi:hypothetical protein